MCPFHGWRYDIQGRNIRVVDRDTFAPETLCDIDLGRVRCEVWNGLVFIHMGDKAESLNEYLGDVAHFMAPYRTEELHTVKEAQVHHVVELESYARCLPGSLPRADDTSGLQTVCGRALSPILTSTRTATTGN